MEKNEEIKEAEEVETSFRTNKGAQKDLEDSRRIKSVLTIFSQIMQNTHPWLPSVAHWHSQLHIYKYADTYTCIFIQIHTYMYMNM